MASRQGPRLLSRLFVRITARIALVSLLFLLLPGLLTTQLALDAIAEHASEERDRLTTLLAGMCAFPMSVEDYATITTIATKFVESPEVLHAEVLTAQGLLLLQVPSGPTPEFSPTQTSHSLQPIRTREGTEIGQVRLTFDISAQLLQRTNTRLQLLALGVGAALLISIVLSYSLRRMVGRPLKTLLHTMHRIEAGDLDVHAPVHRDDEIGELAGQCNTMTARLKQSMQQLNQANEELKDLDRLKSFFLATVSHELRTPLTSIIGYAKLVERDLKRYVEPICKDDEPVSKRCERIRDNMHIINQEGQRLSRLVNDVLDLTRIESGKMDWRDSLISPAKLVEDAQRAVSGQFAMKKHVELRVEADANLPMLYVDPDRIQQVLVNLLHNAAKFTDKGSVTLTVQAQDSRLRFSVTDTGNGIADTDMDHIFGLFQQGSDTKSSRHRGAGMGLAISSLIISHYHGTFHVSSTLGEGSVFAFTLPCNGHPDAVPLPAGSSPAGGMHPA